MSGEEVDSALAQSVISDKEARVADLNEEIEQEKNAIQQLNLSISELQSDILRFQNANKLYQYLKPSTIREHVISDDDDQIEFNEEHQNILKEKRNLIPPVRIEIENLDTEQKINENRLSALRVDYDDAQNSIVEWQEKIRFANSESIKSTRELHYVEDQIAERRNEIRMMESLKREAQAALNSLLERATDGDGVNGQRLETEKSIRSLQTQLREVEEEMIKINERMNRFKSLEEQDIADKENEKAAHSAAVDWVREKEELQQELKELTAQIQQKKNNLKKTETKTTKNTFNTARVLPIVKKWQNKKVPNIIIPDSSIEQMLQELDKIKLEHDNKQKQSESEIAELISNNAKLQEEVKRRRTALERIVTQFHADENSMRKKIDDIRDNADKEKEKLLKLIDATKIKMAQAQIKPQTPPASPNKFGRSSNL